MLLGVCMAHSFVLIIDHREHINATFNFIWKIGSLTVRRKNLTTIVNDLNGSVVGVDVDNLATSSLSRVLPLLARITTFVIYLD